MLEDLFTQADLLLFRDKEFEQAEKIYRQILEIDQSSIEALNSIAYCIKFKTLGYDTNNHNNAVKELSQEANQRLFDQLYYLYLEALKIERDDIEANFNIALLFL